jgi:hypothetical protein
LNRLTEIVVAAVWTAGLLVLWVVAIAAVLMPVTWLADWWIGDTYPILAHPRRNAIVLGIVVMLTFIVLAASPYGMGRPDPPPRTWWWQRKRR